MKTLLAKGKDGEERQFIYNCVTQPESSFDNPERELRINNKYITDSCVDYITNNYHANASFTYCTEG